LSKFLLMSAAMALAASLASANGANATDLPAEAVTATAPGGMYSLWLGGSYFNAPVANGLGTVNDQQDFTFIGQSDNGAALSARGLSGGVSVWKSNDPYDVFAMLDGDFAQATQSYTVDQTGNAGYLDTLPIDGGVSHGTIEAPAPAVNSTADMTYKRVDAALGGGLPGDGRTRIGIGLFGSLGTLDLNATVSGVNPADNTTLQENVSFWSAGPVLMASTSMDLGANTRLVMGAEGAALLSGGALTATQTATDNFIDPGTVTASTTTVAVAGKANLGVVYALTGGMDVSLNGSVGARNDYFSIVNPRSAPGLDADNAASYAPGPAHLQQSWLVSATLSGGIGGHF
jgi:hypothetical protein